MSLDPTSREANIRDSVKKFFVDGLTGKTVTFDKGLNVPRLSGQPMTVTEWVNVDFGDLDIQHMSTFLVRVFVCTRQDNEGFKLAQRRDDVFELLTDDTGTYPDNMARIIFYRSFPTKAWVVIGGMVIQNINESGQMEAADETKYKMLTVTIRFASR